MQEIGGYIELDTYHLPMLHEGAIALNCGRNALRWLLRARKIKRLWIPRFICDSVIGACNCERVPYSLYSIGFDFLPSQEIQLGDGEWLYFVNYYSQFDDAIIADLVKQHKRVIVDHAQSYFQKPLPGVDTLYTCRKYFGVADGAFLYTDSALDEELPRDESFERMRFLLGRFERTASEFYSEYAANNDFFADEPIKKMSKLTNNLLHGIDYKRVKEVREENYRYLHKELGSINLLRLSDHAGTFMYPLYLQNGPEIRKKLQNLHIYIPTLWPDVWKWCNKNETEFRMSENILPLPCDQRYSQRDMKTVCDSIKEITADR